MQTGTPSRSGGVGVVLVMTLLLALASAAHASAAPLDPTTIPKWENTITGPPPVYVETSPDYYVVNVSQFNQTILPPSMGLQTTVYGYGGLAKDAVTGQPLGFVRNSPGPSFEAQRDTAVKVKYVNDLTGSHMFAIDPTIMWANPNLMATPASPFAGFPPGYPTAQSPIPICVHLHGGEVPATVDGGPDAWFTSNGIHGTRVYTAEPTDINAAVYQYPNTQEAATLWYHDHALGMTRLNVVGGMAGFYFLRDPASTVEPLLPQGKYQVPLAIQDRAFNDDGTFDFPIQPTNPDVHPYWGPEFFGDTIMVNGLVWPKMDVDRAAYRFRILDGSTARFYNLSLLERHAVHGHRHRGRVPEDGRQRQHRPGRARGALRRHRRLLERRPGDQRDPAEHGVGTLPRGEPDGPRHHGPDHAVRRREHRRAERPEPPGRAEPDPRGRVPEPARAHRQPVARADRGDGQRRAARAPAQRTEVRLGHLRARRGRARPRSGSSPTRPRTPTRSTSTWSNTRWSGGRPTTP